MSILNFRKQRQYTKNKSGQYDLISNWTSAETVYDRDGHCVMERLDNALLPMVDGTDNGKLLTVKNGGWAKTQNPIIDQSKNAYTFGTRDDEDTVGDYSVVEGNNNAASGDYSHAEGLNTSASGDWGAHAEGCQTIASGTGAHAEGSSTTASGITSHAEGNHTEASGSGAHAEGNNTVARRKDQHVFGEFNILDTQGSNNTVRGKYVEIVGNGYQIDGVTTRSNARTLDWDGNETLAGKLTTTDVIKTSTWDGTNTSLATAVNSAKGTVTQTNSTTNKWYNILFSNSEYTTNEKTEGTQKNNGLLFNPNLQQLGTNEIKVTTTLYGNASNDYNISLQGTASSSNKTITLPNETGTVALTSALPTSTTSNGWYITKFPNIKFAICRYVNTTKHTGGTKSYSTAAAPITFKNATVSVSAMVAGRTDTNVQYTNVSTNGVEAYVSCGVSSATDTRVTFTVFTDYD